MVFFSSVACSYASNVISAVVCLANTPGNSCLLCCCLSASTTTTTGIQPDGRNQHNVSRWFGMEGEAWCIFLHCIIHTTAIASRHATPTTTDIRRQFAANPPPCPFFDAHITYTHTTLHGNSSPYNHNNSMFYTPQLFSALGSSRQQALLTHVIIGVVNVVTTLVAVFTVDSLGR